MTRPYTSTVMRSASANTASMSCSTSRSRAALERGRAARPSSADSCGPMPAIGSSSSSRRGRLASAIAISSARRSPCDSAAAGVVGPVGEPDLGQHAAARSRSRGVARSRAPEAEAVAGVRLHRERDVVERGELAEDAGDLERARDAERAPAAPARAANVVAGEADRAGIRAQFAGELPDQRRLAGAVRADQRVDLAGHDRQRHVAGASRPPNRLVSPDFRAATQPCGPRRLGARPAAPTSRTARARSAAPSSACQCSVQRDSTLFEKR